LGAQKARDLGPLLLIPHHFHIGISPPTTITTTGAGGLPIPIVDEDLVDRKDIKVSFGWQAYIHTYSLLVMIAV